MIDATVEYLGGVRFSAEARGHRLICDQPFGNNGSDEGMTPPELMLASLGTCAAYYAAEYLKMRSLPVEGLRVRVEAEKAMQPARLGSFRIEVISPAAEDERHREGLNRAAKKCLIHHTLEHPPSIEIVVESGVTIGV